MLRLLSVFFTLNTLLFCHAYADTDYTCLKNCVSSGQTYYTCMPKCAYDAAQPTAVQPVKGYGCIKTCIDNGGKTALCASQCSSDATFSDTATSHATPGDTPSHNIFKAIKPSDEVILTPHVIHPVQNTDYGCIRLCMQNGSQYPLCSRQCTK